LKIKQISRTTIYGLIALVALWVIIAVGLHVASCFSDGNARFYGSVLQLSSSSWPGQRPFDRHTWWFALGVASRLVLLLSPILGIIVLFERMITIGDLPMTFIDIMEFRNNNIRDLFISKLKVSDDLRDQYSDEFDAAVRETQDRLATDLIDLLGPDRGRMVMDRIRQVETAPIV
jgi:hypothetical protein